LLEQFVQITEKAHGPDYGIYLSLATTYAMMGRMEEARAYVAKALEGNSGFSIEVLRKMQLYKNQEHTNQILDALHKAGLPEQSESLRQ